MPSKALSGKQAQAFARRNIKQRGVKLAVNRPNPRPATTRTVTCMPQQMGAAEAAKLMAEGSLNLGAPLPVNFVCLDTDDILKDDEIPYNNATYTVLSVMPQDYGANSAQTAAVTLFKEAKAIVLR